LKNSKSHSTFSWENPNKKDIQHAKPTTQHIQSEKKLHKFSLNINITQDDQSEKNKHISHALFMNQIQ